jgi:hypothetical protein
LGAALLALAAFGLGVWVGMTLAARKPQAM